MHLASSTEDVGYAQGGGMASYDQEPFYKLINAEKYPPAIDSYTDLVLLEQSKAGSKDQDQSSLKPEQAAIDRITEQSLIIAHDQQQHHQQQQQQQQHQHHYDQALDKSNLVRQQPHNRLQQQQQQQRQQQQQPQPYNQDQSIIVPQPPSVRRTQQGRRQAAAGQFRPPPPLLPTKSRFQEIQDFVQNLRDAFFDFVDVPLLRAMVDLYFDGASPRGRIQQDALPTQRPKNEGIRRFLTTLTAGMFGKQQCWDKLLCKMGELIGTVRGKNIFFLIVERTVPESWPRTRSALSTAKQGATDKQYCHRYECNDQRTR